MKRMSTKKGKAKITMLTICPCELGEYRPPNMVDGRRHIWCEIEDGYVGRVTCSHLKILKEYRQNHPVYRKVDEHGILTITVQPKAQSRIMIVEVQDASH